MAITRVDFTEWLPDQPGVVGALTNARNVFPKAVGYGPFPEEEDYSQAASQALNSVVEIKDPSGNTRVFAGGSTKLFLLDGATKNLNDVSGTTYSSTDRWRFVEFGSYLIATNGQNRLQYADLATTTVFSDLDASAPTAKVLSVIRDFVVVGNTSTDSNGVQWSGINNPNTWAESAVTQSDKQIIPDGGQVVNITGGEFGLVLLEKSIVRMSYVGTPLIFQFDKIASNIGCYETNSVVQWQGITYFLADDGFWSCDGQKLEPIGAEKVNRFFFDTIEESVIGQMSASIDPFRSLVIWGYPSIDSTYRLLVYHWVTKRWSFVETTVNGISNIAAPGTTLEDLDAVSPSLDDLQTSLDSRVWLGGKMFLGGVKGPKIISFSGQSKTARVTTSDLSAGENMSMVTLARPVVDGGLASVAVSSRFNLAEAVNFGTAVAASSENRVGLRSLGRYHRLRVIPSGDWTTAIGVEVDIQPAGSR
jgi:hypothetical protein